MISTEESNGAPSPESHDASLAQLPASTRVYVQGQLHPQIRVPMRESRTLHHDVIGEFGAGKVILRSAPAGTGIIAMTWTGWDRTEWNLLGNTGGLGQMMGVDNAWMLNVVRTLGNYGEIFERNLGRGSQIGLERGLNGLWNRGGLMYAPPIR